MRALLLLASVMSSPAKESHIFLSSEHRLVGKLASALNLRLLIGLVFERVESWQDAAVCPVTFNRGHCKFVLFWILLSPENFIFFKTILSSAW